MLSQQNRAGITAAAARAYTAAGMTLTRTDGRGNTTTTRTDQAGRAVSVADAAAYEAEDSRRKERLDLHNQAEVLAYKVDEALSKCKKELDKDEKNRIKTDLANLRRCLRKDKPEKMNETEEAALRQAKSQLEASANHLMVLYTSQTEQDAAGNDTAGSV